MSVGTSPSSMMFYHANSECCCTMETVVGTESFSALRWYHNINPAHTDTGSTSSVEYCEIWGRVYPCIVFRCGWSRWCFSMLIPSADARWRQHLRLRVGCFYCENDGSWISARWWFVSLRSFWTRAWLVGWRFDWFYLRVQACFISLNFIASSWTHHTLQVIRFVRRTGRNSHRLSEGSVAIRCFLSCGLHFADFWFVQ